MKSLSELSFPSRLRPPDYFNDSAQVIEWENGVYQFFQEHHKLFTPYPDYFKVRCYEFRIIRQLLPEVFDLSAPQDSILELGCGYGFKSLLMKPWARHVLGVDIPAKYKGYVRGDFSSSVDIARLVICNKLRAEGVHFESMWPNELDLEDDSISLLVSDYLLEHIPDLGPAIAEMARVLAPGGMMLHVVPSTRESAMKFIEAQMDLRFIDMVKLLAKKALGRPSGSRISVNGTVYPIVHSEFINNYRDQLKVYSLESYLFPMIEAGLEIVKILTTREHNHVILARKPDGR